METWAAPVLQEQLVRQVPDGQGRTEIPSLKKEPLWCPRKRCYTLSRSGPPVLAERPRVAIEQSRPTTCPGQFGASGWYLPRYACHSHQS